MVLKMRNVLKQHELYHSSLCSHKLMLIEISQEPSTIMYHLTLPSLIIAPCQASPVTLPVGLWIILKPYHFYAADHPFALGM